MDQSLVDYVRRVRTSPAIIAAPPEEFDLLLFPIDRSSLVWGTKTEAAVRPVAPGLGIVVARRIFFLDSTR